MMNFLRQLAPAWARDATRAVAALPSYFERVAPLRLAAVTAASSASSEATPLRASETTHVQAADTGGADRDRAPRTPVPVHRRSGDQIGEGHSATCDLAPRTSDERERLTGRHAATSRQAVAPDTAAPIAHTRSRVIADIPAGARAATGSSPRVRLPETPKMLLAPAQPMSQAALAGRIARETRQPPVVHVTIDRIDVRAPTPAERAAPPSKRQTAAPSVSLGDYLRARGPTRTGGVS
jgi:hypothetical protein